MYKKSSSKNNKEDVEGEVEVEGRSPLFVLKKYNESDTSNKHCSIVELELLSYEEVNLQSLNLTLLDLNGSNSSDYNNKSKERLRYFECCVRLITGNTLSYIYYILYICLCITYAI